MRTLLFTILFILTSASLFARSAYRVEGNNVIIQLDAHGIKSNIFGGRAVVNKYCEDYLIDE